MNGLKVKDTRVCMLTVLNPALHPRIFYKEARSLSVAGYRVFIAGRHEAKENKEGIEIIPLPVFSRTSLKRWGITLSILRVAWRIDAAVYHIHSPELLPLTLILKLRGAKIIYDVHENYRRNILYGKHYPFILKFFLAGFMRFLEKFSCIWVDRVIYSEKAYAGLLPLSAGNSLVLENYFIEADKGENLSETTSRNHGVVIINKKELKFLYSGTIAGEWGIFNTLNVFRHVLGVRRAHLMVAGHSQNPEEYRKFLSRIKEWNLSPFVSIEGGAFPVPYSRIQSLIRETDFAFALYEPLPHIRETIPSKFYEYIHYRKPVLFTPLEKWIRLNQEINFGYPLYAEHDLSSQIEAALRTEYFQKPFSWEAYHWKYIEKKLLDLYADILSPRRET